MKTIINKLVLSALFLFTMLMNGQMPQPTDPDEGGGTTGPGSSPSAPIDMYILGLSVIAIIFIVFYTRKYKAQKI